MTNKGTIILDIRELAEKLAPEIAQRLLITPAVFGDPKRVSIGNNVTINNALLNTSSGNISIDENTFFGHNVCLLTGKHDISKKGIDRRSSIPHTGCDIVIGKGVWLSSNVTIIGPVTIGDNAVIAAGSLVLKDVEANSLFAGSPAKFIKKIDFS